MSVLIPSLRPAIAVPGWAKNELWRRARAVPSLDLRFADNKSLVDATTGANLVTFTRASEATFVNSQGQIQTAAIDAPRFDHNPTTGESLGLLVEEARTNLSPYSSYVAGQWTFQAASLGTSTRTSPTGSTVTAFLSDNTTTAHRVIRSLSGSYTANTLYTFSFYVAKPPGSDVLGLIARVRSSAGGQAVIFFVNDNGEQSGYTFSDSAPFGTSPPAAITSSSVSINSVGNNWTRIAITTAVASADTTLTQWDIGFSTLSGGEAGEGTAESELYIDSVQLEQGAFATSVIPTSGTAATRAADVASITGTNFSSWANNNAGTMLTDSTIIATSVQTQGVWQLGGGSVVSSLRQPHLTANQFRAVIGGTFTASPGTGGALNAGITKAAVAYSGTTGRLQVGDSGADAAGSNLDSNALDIGSLGGATQLNGRIKRLVFWPQRLPDATLQSITR